MKFTDLHFLIYVCMIVPKCTTVLQFIYQNIYLTVIFCRCNDIRRKLHKEIMGKLTYL